MQLQLTIKSRLEGRIKVWNVPDLSLTRPSTQTCYSATRFRWPFMAVVECPFFRFLPDFEGPELADSIHGNNSRVF